MPVPTAAAQAHAEQFAWEARLAGPALACSVARVVHHVTAGRVVRETVGCVGPSEVKLGVEGSNGSVTTSDVGHPLELLEAPTPPPPGRERSLFLGPRWSCTSR
jgi:hypothetical protein